MVLHFAVGRAAHGRSRLITRNYSSTDVRLQQLRTLVSIIHQDVEGAVIYTCWLQLTQADVPRLEFRGIWKKRTKQLYIGLLLCRCNPTGIGCTELQPTTQPNLRWIMLKFIFGPILWGRSGPLCHALSLWTSILHCHSPGVATIARRLRYSWLRLILVVVSTVATPGEWQCKIRTGGVRRLAVANGSNIFQMLLV